MHRHKKKITLILVRQKVQLHFITQNILFYQPYTFFQAVSITSRTMGLTGFLNLHDRARSIVRSLLALPLLPRDLIGEGFMSLAYEAADEGVYAVLHQFFLKINTTWLSGFRYEMLSVFLAEHRTNNVSESANRMLRLRTHVHHPNISLFLGEWTNALSGLYWIIPAQLWLNSTRLKQICSRILPYFFSWRVLYICSLPLKL